MSSALLKIHTVLTCELGQTQQLIVRCLRNVYRNGDHSVHLSFIVHNYKLVWNLIHICTESFLKMELPPHTQQLNRCALLILSGFII